MADVATLLAIEEIRSLKARYCRYADGKRWEDLAGLFVPGGVLRFYDAEGALKTEVASADVPAVLGGRIIGDGQPIHHLFSHEIEITSPDTARAIWAMEDLIFQPDGSAAPYRTMHGFGHYHETYRRLDGVWKIATLDLFRLRLDFTR